MVTAHREAERKFEVQQSTQLPDFAALPGVAVVSDPVVEKLDGTYFDLPDLRLASAGVTLRKRTGGRDAGWHLKVPAADDSRTEFQHPLGKGSTVPKKLLDPIKGLVRNGRLSPIVRIRTRRTAYQLFDADRHALAEVADDTVTAQVLDDSSGAEVSTWREIEVELVEGGDELLPAASSQLERCGATPARARSKLRRALGDRLPAPPAPPQGKKVTAADVIHQALRDHLRRLRDADRGIRLDTPDSVHQARVAARRFRSVLREYRPMFDRAVTEPLRDELRWFGVVLGDARDAEVLRERLLDAVHALPDKMVLGPVAARIESTMAARARDADAEMRALLDSDRYFALLDALETLVSDPPWQGKAAKPARKVLPRRVYRTWQRVRDLAESGAPLHEIRKAAKRARYAGETAAPALGKTAEKYAKAMKRLQTVLGEHQDAVVAQDSLRQMGAQAQLAGENGFTFGLLHGAEQVHATNAAADHHDAYARAEKRAGRLAS
jgi:CHAD domain-containing protein